MRHNVIYAIAAMPAIVLAQAPSASTFSTMYQQTRPMIETLLKDLKAKDAQAQLESTIPAEMPKYAISTEDELKANYGKAFQAIFTSQQDYNGIAGLQMLLSNSLMASGEWEKAKAAMEKALKISQDNSSNFKLAAAPVRSLWAGIVKQGDDFKANNEEKIKAIAAKEKKAPEEEAVVKQYEAHMAVFADNASKAGKINAALDNSQAEVDRNIPIVTKALEAIDKQVADQAAAIKKYNEEQEAAKPKTPITWVTAVLNTKENITSLPSDRVRVEFLNRLLVLEPNNSKAMKVMENIMWGRDPFFEDAPKPAPKPARKATKGKAK